MVPMNAPLKGDVRLAPRAGASPSVRAGRKHSGSPRSEDLPSVALNTQRGALRTSPSVSLQWRHRRAPRSTATSLEWAAAASVLFRLVPENEFGISEQKPKPDRRHDNQGDRRDEIPKAILGHRQRY